MYEAKACYLLSHHESPLAQDLEFFKGWMRKLLTTLNHPKGSGEQHSIAPWPLSMFKKHLFIPNMQYCRFKLNLSVNSSLLFPAPRWNEATLLLMKRNLSEANERLAHCTASQATRSHSSISSASFYSRINVAFSLHFYSAFVKAVLRWIFDLHCFSSILYFCG